MQITPVTRIPHINDTQEDAEEARLRRIQRVLAAQKRREAQREFDRQQAAVESGRVWYF